MQSRSNFHALVNAGIEDRLYERATVARLGHVPGSVFPGMRTQVRKPTNVALLQGQIPPGWLLADGTTEHDLKDYAAMNIEVAEGTFEYQQFHVRNQVTFPAPGKFVVPADSFADPGDAAHTHASIMYIGPKA